MGGGSGLKKYRGLLLAALFLPALLLGCGGGTSGAGSAASSGQAEASVTEEPKKTSSAETPAPAPAEESPAPTAAEPAETTPIPPPESLPAGEAAEPSEVPEESPAGKWIGWLPLTRAIRAVEIPSRSRWARGLRRRRQKSVPERMGRHQA